MLHNRKIARRYAKAFLHDNLGKDEIDVLTSEIMSFVMALESDEKAREFFITPEELIIHSKYICQLDSVGTIDLPWEDMEDGAYLMEGDPDQFFTSGVYCFDCQVRGGTIIRPAFWE